MTLKEGKGRFSQSFAEAIRLERNHKYEAACELYLKEAAGLQRNKDLQQSALCFLLAGRCKLEAERGAREEFENAAKIYLEIADHVKDASPSESRLAYRCAQKCFLRAGLYDRAQEVQHLADSIKQLKGIKGKKQQPIMIVDDSNVVTSKLKKYVTEFGLNDIVICNSGREALEKFKKLIDGNKPPIVLLDMMMPDITGNQVAAKMLEIRPETAIALITADSIDSDRVKEALAGGVGYFLRKPFRYNEIKKLLDLIQYEETVI